MIVALLDDRANLHFLRRAEPFTATDGAMVRLPRRVGADHAQALGAPVHGQMVARFQRWAPTYREALTQTFADIFLVILACFVVATALAPLMRKVAPPTAPPADAH
jgi:DHA2 family multidrug resistance protein